MYPNVLYDLRKYSNFSHLLVSSIHWEELKPLQLEKC